MPLPGTNAVAIVLAAGEGARLGSHEPKAFLEIDGAPMVVHAVRAASGSGLFERIVVTVPPGLEDRARALLDGLPTAVDVIAGGSSRHASVDAGLSVVPPEVGVVFCHDAARPFARPALFVAVADALQGVDGAIPVLAPSDTVKRVRDGVVVATEPREEIGLAQTPQAFSAAALRDSHERAASAEMEFTDDAAALEWAGYRVRVILGDPDNVKITTAADLARVGERT